MNKIKRLIQMVIMAIVIIIYFILFIPAIPAWLVGRLLGTLQARWSFGD